MSFSASKMTKFRSLQLEGHDENGRQSEFLAGGNSNMCVLCSPGYLGKVSTHFDVRISFKWAGLKNHQLCGFFYCGFRPKMKDEIWVVEFL